ncbi:MAG: hypothetical protein WD069_18035 [Planctomycetales bacterium]
MNARRSYRWCGCLLLASLLLPAAAAADDEKLFPFDAEVDAAAGKTGALPNRVRVKELDLWLRLVPAGKYEIGDDALRDSRKIEVRLDAYYIAESELTHAQFARFRMRQSEFVARWLVQAFAELDVKGKELTTERQAALRVLLKSESLTLELNPDVPESLRKECERLTAEIEQEFGLFDDMEEEDFAEDSAAFFKRLDEVDSERVKDFDARLDKQLEALWKSAVERGDVKPVSESRQLSESLTGAGLYGEGVDLHLPTEAEWEVAARLVADEKLPLVGMFDEHHEWCADYYAHDYFDRSKDFANPRGPRRGRLDEKQRKLEQPKRRRTAPALRLFDRVVFGRWDADYRVVRGTGVSVRGYDHGGGHAVRLVFRPKPPGVDRQ